MTPPVRFAVLSDTHLAPAATPDGRWNNVTCLSACHELLRAAVEDIASAGISQVVLLGDVSDRGDHGMIATALAAITGAGMRAWAVPGNHDVSVSPDALTQAVKRFPGCTVISQGPLEVGPGIAVRGHAADRRPRRQTASGPLSGLPEPAAGCRASNAAGQWPGRVAPR